MEHAYFKLLHMLSGHPGWALAVVALAALLESVAFIGTFVPGSTAMFVAGALVGTGTLNLGWVFVCAIAGAIAGDAASYWVGARYQESLRQIWPFRTHPAVLAAGEKYFVMHGAKSVVTARFLPPLRAVVPVVAGMLGMAPARFFAVNVLSALLWAPVHILPGVVFGASIELAGAVSFRLVVVVAIVAVAAWLTYNVIRITVSHARSWTSSSRQRLIAWAERHPGRSRRVVMRALSPESPAAGLIATISVFLLVSAAVFFSTLEDIAHGDPIVQVDMSAYRFLQSFRSTWADDLLAVFSTLGSLPTLSALVVLVIAWMALERRWRTIAYWLAAVAFSQVLILAIQIATRHLPLGALASNARAFPSNHVAAAVIIYGFLAFIVERRVGTVARVLVAVATVAVVSAVTLAGLYFDRFTLSDALGGAALAAIWVFLVALTAVWRHPEKPRARPLMPVAVLAVIGVAVAVQLATGNAFPTAEGAQRPEVIVVTPGQWTDKIWRTFSCYRSNMEGDRREPITVQWAATAEQMKAQLESRGWTEGTRLSAHSLLSLVSPNVTATALPVLPRLNNGEPSQLEFVRSHEGDDQRDVLRFWPTRYAVERQDGSPAAPIWLGSLVHERLRRPSWPFNVLRPTRQVEPMIAEHGEGSPWHDIEVARSMGCEGVRVTLIASRAQ
ncbi:DedA family protein [Caballeronia arationis]|jgi:undecaprenyl-diphosphatase|uniref:Membrane protein DedA, SNARE-associated domain n=1 Tax=Caballeronia arationis TaxID=1777142 RepID=A0A7Z7N2C4_9BURK|nr:VTT domain-containing protein [Caballeronia arationis]SAK54479.1 DedA family protein [Caballeronia arationis]SOE61136.1 membrane protein DedA, SNARE-associated domain [Caballeronia arationis]